MSLFQDRINFLKLMSTRQKTQLYEEAHTLYVSRTHVSSVKKRRLRSCPTIAGKLTERTLNNKVD